jgi:hypothetical protein
MVLANHSTSLISYGARSTCTTTSYLSSSQISEPLDAPARALDADSTRYPLAQVGVDYRLRVDGHRHDLLGQDLRLADCAGAPEPGHLAARMVGVNETSQRGQQIESLVGERVALDSN